MKEITSRAAFRFLVAFIAFCLGSSMASRAYAQTTPDSPTADGEGPSDEKLVEPAAASTAPAQQEPAPANSAPAVQSESVPDVVPSRRDQRGQRRLEGLALFGAAYSLAAVVGGYVALRSEAGSCNCFGLPLLIPVAGPLYVGGKGIVDSVSAIVNPQNDLAIYAYVALPMFTVVLVDGLVQAAGLLRIAFPGPGPARPVTGFMPKKLAVHPFADAHSGGLSLSGS
ncbi:MAG: hypothetical protein HOO96_44075, partial [Polyangiaceae bacterium]|nr:hypothetical protein [Polyangiaceae bacterium]